MADKNKMTLKDLEIGKSAIIKKVGGEGVLRQHFVDMGVIPGTMVTVIKYAPMGDPIELLIHGYELTLRLDDAKKIEVEEIKIEKDQPKSRQKTIAKKEHPGLGEDGKYHIKADENPLPKGTILTFALAGNQNCGKTTLFNQLTGANQHVGNFPGVTVDQKSGEIKNLPDTLVTDLPGIYSLSPYTSEEIISREFILNEKPKCIINIVDASNIERNLYLTLQLLELEIPTVIALNMMDEVRNNGGTIDINEMEDILGVPVVPISASKNEGVDELVKHAVHIAKYREKPGRTDFCDDREGATHRCIHGIMHLIDDHAHKKNIPVRFAACKLVEGDELIRDALELSQNELEMIEHIICQMEEECELDRSAVIADMRYSFIKRLCEETVVKPKESKEHKRSRRIDKVLTGRFTALPMFVLIMGIVFFLTFNVIGAFLQDVLKNAIVWIIDVADVSLSALRINPILHSLITEGIFEGVGSILSFIPIIVVLYFFLSLLEDSGYMARIAFVTDKLLRKIGLSGRSVVPMLIGFGCTVPAVMASRTLPSERDRKMTIMLTPFMSCTAKLPVYGFISMAFFPKYSGLVMLILYFIGIFVGIIAALLSKKIMFKGEAVPFVMELPNYRLPNAKNVALLLWDKAKDFLQRAFTIIFIASIVIWFAQRFDFKLDIVKHSQDSILANVAGIIAPIFKPLGFGDWRISTALIAGFTAKESVVSTLTVLIGSAGKLSKIITPISAAALLVFCLLYTPCVAAIAAIKRELGTKWAYGTVVFQCAVAWVCAFLVKIVLSIIFGG